MTRVGDLAVVRTKNVSPFELCVDVLCHDRPSYERLLAALSVAVVARLYGVAEADCELSSSAPALAIKFTIPREVDAGGVGDRDIFGAAQAVPLQELPLQEPPRTESSPMEPQATPINLFEYQERARELLPKHEYDFIAQGATDEITVRRARTVFDSILLRQRVLRDIATRDLSTTVLGRRVECPIMICPAGFHTRVTPDGELATARAAHAMGTVIVLSNSSSHTLEDVGAATPGGKWFQHYLYRDRDLTLTMAKRAADAGYDAVCITLDFPPVPPKRERSIRNRYSQEPSPNYAGLGVPRYDYGLGHDAMRGVGELIDHSATWDDLHWFTEHAGLPVVVKGILAGEDGALAAESGVRGIVVSAHGGRQLDTTVTSIEALPEVVSAVAGRAEVFLDSGIRRGTDVFKALALGARAVLFGRPLFWGLAVGGEAGLRDVIQILRDELELTMALCGHSTTATIGPDSLYLSSPLVPSLSGTAHPTSVSGALRF